MLISTMSPSCTNPITPPPAASGLTWPIDRPDVPPEKRHEIEDLGHGFYRMIIRIGFMDEADVPAELAAEIFTPLISYGTKMPGPADRGALLVVNYAQLRLNTAWFHRHNWDAVILDEAQFIKNPTSQTAAIARAIPAAQRSAAPTE